MKPAPNLLKSYTQTDPEFVKDVIRFSLEKFYENRKTTSRMSVDRAFWLLSELQDISTPSAKILMPHKAERALRFDIAVCRACIKSVS